MPLPRRAILAAAPLLGLAACFGRPGGSQVAQDAGLIVSSITPIAQGVGSLGVAPEVAATVRSSLATATREATALSVQGTPTLIDTQEFFEAAQTLLQSLESVSGLPPSSNGTIEAAVSLLPVFANVFSGRVALTPKMSPDQARLILRGSGEPAVVAAPPRVQPAAPPVSAPVVAPVAPMATAPRFHVSADDLDGRVSFEFLDRGQVIERGVVADFRALETRYEAFKRRRLAAAPS